MATYFVEYGALQANACRLIECETSANPASKISEDFARRIAYGLNMTEPGAMQYIPDDPDLNAIDQLADRLINSGDTYGGGIIKTMVRDYRDLKRRRLEFINAQRDSRGFPLPADKTEEA
jgi:hypothetical protein